MIRAFEENDLTAIMQIWLDINIKHITSFQKNIGQIIMRW